MKRFVSTTRSVRALCSAAAIGGAILASHAGALAQNNVLSLESKIQQRMHIRGAAVVKLNVADVPGAAQQVVVPLAGQLVTLDLQPYSLRDPAYTCWEQRDDGLFYQVDPGPESTWRGTVLELPGSMVAGGLVKGGIFARVTIPDGREYWIEHIGGRIDGADDATHIIYTLDNLMQGDNRCGNTIMPDRPPPKPGEDDGGAAPRGATLYTAQLATDADWEYFQDYGGTTWVSQRISAVINTMNVQYERDVNITHVISQSVIRTTSADPYTTTDPATLNAQIQTAWNGMAGTRDVIQLFTGRDIDGSVIGRANAIGSICSAGNGASNCYVQSDFNGNFMSAADLSAHELGHLWDATHCTCSNPASTMNPSITSINRFTFSPNNNQTQIVTYRNGLGCLTTSGTGGPPRNDECIDGVPISTGRFGFSNIGATTDPAPVPTACGSIGDDIWYTFLAPCDGMMSIDTCNNANEEPGFDTVLAVYTGSCSSLTQVTCNDDDAGCTVSSPARRSLVTFAVTRNTLYRIRVGGFSGANGSGIIDFDLLSQDCPPVPTNDACGGAITISECSGTVAASNVGADADGFVEVTDCTAASSSAIFNDLWYRVVAPCTGNIRVSTCGSAIDTKVAIFNSCPTGPNQSIACNDDNGPGCAGLDASVDFAAAAGSDYFIQVGSYNPATTGNISISVSALACPTPANDVCAGATVISTGTRSFTNVNACSEGAMGCGSGAASVWYAFTPSTSCNYTLTTCSLTTLDTVFGIYDECSSTTPIICVDDSCGLQTTISWNATAGEDYFIRLHGFGGAFGTGQFNLAANGPANDLCANAAVASLGVNNFDNRCSAGEGANGCGSGNASVFYTFTSPVTSMLNISTCDLTTIDSVIGVYTNCAATTP
ncbi:MAG: M12 family metallo-peptidase, partial [Phycisphaerales bacterium]